MQLLGMQIAGHLMNMQALFAQVDVPVTGAPAAAAGAAPAAAAASGQPPMWGNILLFGGMFVLIYFMMIRPQSQRAKKQKSFLDDLKVGARVVTTSGLFGEIVTMKGSEVELKIADRVTIRMLKSQIAGAETTAAQAVADANAR